MIRVQALDHLVLDVADVERSLAWYCGELGLAAERVDDWRDGKVLFPSVRIDEHTIIDLFAVQRTSHTAPEGTRRENLNHFCIVVEPTDLQAVADSGRFDVVDGPASRWGARGDGTSLYVRDPDGNVVELRYYD